MVRCALELICYILALFYRHDDPRRSSKGATMQKRAGWLYGLYIDAQRFNRGDGIDIVKLGSYASLAGD